jgi:hypothetical protein
MTPQSSAGATFGLGVLSSAVAGYGKYESGQQQKQAYDYNAAVITQNTSNEVVANQQKFSTLVGRQATGYAAAGVDIASGSPLLIMAATAARGAQQGEQIEQAGTEQAALQRYYGKIAAFGGTMAGIGAFLNGVSADATAYSKATSNPTPSVSGGSGMDSIDSGI